MHKFPSSLLDGIALPVHQLPMNLHQLAHDLRFSSRVDKVAVQKESHLVMAICMRRPPSEETYGVMMSFDAVRG